MSRGPPGPPGMTGSRGQETAATHAPPAGPEAAAAERGSAFPRLSHERARADRRTPGRLPSCTRLNGCLLPPCRKREEALHELQGGTGALPSHQLSGLQRTRDAGGRTRGHGAGRDTQAACPPGLLPQPCPRHLTLQQARGSRTRRPPTASSALLAETQPPRPRPQPTGAESDATAPESRLGRGGDHVPWFGRTVLESMLSEAL